MLEVLKNSAKIRVVVVLAFVQEGRGFYNGGVFNKILVALSYSDRWPTTCCLSQTCDMELSRTTRVLLIGKKVGAFSILCPLSCLDFRSS